MTWEAQLATQRGAAGRPTVADDATLWFGLRAETAHLREAAPRSSSAEGAKCVEVR